MFFQRSRHVVLKSFLQENLARDKFLGFGLVKQFNLKRELNIQLMPHQIFTTKLNPRVGQKWL